MRIRHKPWAMQEIKDNPDIVVPEPEKWRGRWNECFSHRQPLHLEIGTGKGQFIVEMAKAYPTTNFIGLELQSSVIVSALSKIKAEGVSNVLLINKHAQDLRSFFAQGEIELIYLNFSDPWPKNRHAKRRLTHANYLAVYKEILKKGGEIHLKTDNEKLFEFSLNSFSDAGFRLKNICFDLHQSEWTNNITTEYEDKFVQQGMKIYRCEAIVPHT